MDIKHHPDLSNLMSCAAGSQPEAFAAVMAAHISMCPQCARELATMELIGASLFEDVAPAPVERSAPMALAGATEADMGTNPQPAAKPAAGSRGDVPAPLVALVGSRLDDVPWKRLAPGVWHYPLPLSKDARGDLRLIKVAPGMSVPEHGHGGEELTLLLKGSFHDKMGEFRTGDVADLDDDVEHQPVADANEGCVCLVASEGKARFKGLLARMMQPLKGL